MSSSLHGEQEGKRGSIFWRGFVHAAEAAVSSFSPRLTCFLKLSDMSVAGRVARECCREVLLVKRSCAREVWPLGR